MLPRHRLDPHRLQECPVQPEPARGVPLPLLSWLVIPLGHGVRELLPLGKEEVEVQPILTEAQKAAHVALSANEAGVLDIWHAPDEELVRARWYPVHGVDGYAALAPPRQRDVVLLIRILSVSVVTPGEVLRRVLDAYGIGADALEERPKDRRLVGLGYQLG